ncbi:NAD kinase b [Silurus meridionalis]|uniref:NAD kinase b n=1 Tax=Silurus meridionalis TaxID=175797 RepID=UPI001EE9F293|nr:NAD kinase b [Silurus meridionalis]
MKQCAEEPGGFRDFAERMECSDDHQPDEVSEEQSCDAEGHSKSPKRRREMRRSRRRANGMQQTCAESHDASETCESSTKRLDKCRRAHFLHGPYPSTHFGPKACILPNPTSIMHIQDPVSQRLVWNKPPLNVLVIRKIRDLNLLEPFKELCSFLIQEKGLCVYVPQEKGLCDGALMADESFSSIRRQLCTFRGFDDISDCIDLIVCLGGDGTLLYASSLFQGSVPPVMAFHLGSLGFLTPFKFESYKTEVDKVFAGNAAVVLRSRLKVKVLKGSLHRDPESSSVTHTHNQVTLQLQVLNEVVVDRGPSSYLSNVDLYLDGRLITSVQGDGVIVSTPTGSTAYAAAAGASMIHPNVPAIMVTPICPHSLSFRPIVVPAGVELMITLSPEARNTAWVSFDGRKRQEIQHGDSIRITTSCYPVPSLCCHGLVYDWFESLAECLHWNIRKKQTHLSDVSDSTDTDT